jgi:hypothetical protein
MNREVDVLALTREDSLFVSSQVGVVDAALELLAPLQDGPVASAIAGGWAAIESSLVDPVDRGNVVAADRLASIVAGSWPRAELTRLGHTHVRNGNDQLASDLRAARDECGEVRAAAYGRSGGVADTRRVSQRRCRGGAHDRTRD